MSDLLNDQQFESYVLRLTENALKPENIISKMCFLCGDQPTTGKGEHVIPKWLQNRLNLWDCKIGLLNGSLLPYRDLRIPACAKCNGEVLGKTEGYVSKLSADSIKNWTLSDSYEVGRWMAKILVGILVKETSLAKDRRRPELGVIFSPDAMDEMILLHLLVQSWRKLILFRAIHTQHPFTLYVYSISEDERYGAFNLSTNILGKSICMRIGGVGFAFVGDGGLQHEMADLGPFDLAGQRLHPVQFDELAARVHYKAILRDATHSYIHAEDPDTFRFQQMTVLPYTNIKLADGSDRVFRPWSLRELAEVLRFYKVPEFERLIDESGEAVFTRLVDETGNRLSIEN